MSCRYRIILITMLLGIYGIQQHAYSQPSAREQLEAFVKNISDFNRYYPQEKVYLHLDNTGYYMGETIWFKAYVVRTDADCLSNISGVLYVELVDPTGEVMGCTKLKINEGSASGWIKLQGLLNSGFYEIRAYTRYMVNWPSSIYSRIVPILNAPKQEGDYSDRTMDVFSYEKRLPDNREQEMEPEKKMNVGFYPEGGHLVQGVENRVAFAVTDEDGAHFETTGWLEDDGQRIAEVRTIREGRGYFLCRPGAKRLTFHLMNKKGSERTFRLPKAEAEGVAMIVNRTDSLTHLINLNPSASYLQQSLGVITMHNGKVKWFGEMSQAERLHIPSSAFGDGVNQLAVVDMQGNVLAERMVFSYPRSHVTPIDIQVEEDMLKPYGKITLDVTSLPKSRFSLSVRDYDTQVQGWQSDAWSWLLLTSDLKGYIENPRYYFESNDEDHRQAADLLMMVQGWRRYDVSQLIKGGTTLREIPERTIGIRGRIYAPKGESYKRVDSINITTIVPATKWSKNYITRHKKTDSRGFFDIDSLDFIGKSHLIFRPEENDELLHYDFSFNRYFSPPVRHVFKNESLPIPIDTPRIKLVWKDDSSLVRMTDYSHLLQMVEVKGRRRSMPMSAYWTNEKMGARRASIYYDCKKESNRLREQRRVQPDFLKWLEEKNKNFSGSWGSEAPDPNGKQDVAGIRKMVHVRDGVDYKRRPVVWIINNNFYCLSFAPRELSQITARTDTWGWIDFPSTLDEVNSVYISEDDQAWKSYLQVQNLESYKPVTVFIYGRREDSADRWERMRRGLRAIEFDGYQQPQTFESPNYKILPAIPDHRRTLYWNPDVRTDDKGKVKLEFYNNTSCRSIAISAEGIQKDGRVMVY